MLSCNSPRTCWIGLISAGHISILPVHHIQSCERTVHLPMNVQHGHSLRTNENSEGFLPRTHSSPSMHFASEPSHRARGLRIRTDYHLHRRFILQNQRHLRRLSTSSELMTTILSWRNHSPSACEAELSLLFGATNVPWHISCCWNIYGRRE